MRKGTKKAAEVKSGKSKVSAVHGAGRTSTQTAPSCFTQYACKALRSSCFFFRRSARYKCVSCPPGVSPFLPQSTSNYKAMFPALPPKIPSLGSWLPRIVWSAPLSPMDASILWPCQSFFVGKSSPSRAQSHYIFQGHLPCLSRVGSSL